VNSQLHKSSPHVIAAIGTIIILTFLPVFFYFVLTFVTADVGGLLNLVLIPCSNLIATILFTAIFFFPLSKLLDWIWQRMSLDGQRRISSFLFSGIVLVLILVFVVGGFTLTMGTILENPLALRVLGKQDIDSVMVWLLRFLFLGGVPFLLGGVTYWFLLQTSRKLCSNRED